MARDAERDVREEVKIALFWRALIGDYEYIKYDPADMMRWYDALELRGPLEIRDLMQERYASRPMPAVLGIVSGAPHPPTWLVRDWLAFHEQKVKTGSLWLGASAVLVMCGMLFHGLHGCADLQPLSIYAMHPPASGQPVYSPSAPLGSQSQPNVSIPPMSFTPGKTGPASAGIAGAAMGVATPGGATGPGNSGISSGSTSTAPAVGAGQP